MASVRGGIDQSHESQRIGTITGGCQRLGTCGGRCPAPRPLRTSEVLPLFPLHGTRPLLLGSKWVKREGHSWKLARPPTCADLCQLYPGPGTTPQRNAGVKGPRRRESVEQAIYKRTPGPKSSGWHVLSPPLLPSLSLLSLPLYPLLQPLPPGS